MLLHTARVGSPAQTGLRKNAGRRRRKRTLSTIRSIPSNCPLSAQRFSIAGFPAYFVSGPTYSSLLGTDGSEQGREGLSWNHDLLTPSIPGRQKPPVL
jgi:hypothetical protein